jgi:hypothetical protein
MKSAAKPQAPVPPKSASNSTTSLSQQSSKTAGSSLLAALEATSTAKGTKKGIDSKDNKQSGTKFGNSVKGKAQGKNK